MSSGVVFTDLGQSMLCSKCVYYNEPVSLLNPAVRVVIHVLSTAELSPELSAESSGSGEVYVVAPYLQFN